MVSSKPRPYFTPEKGSVPIVQEAGWAQGRSGHSIKYRLILVTVRYCNVQSKRLLSLYIGFSVCYTAGSIPGYPVSDAVLYSLRFT
jgi:hypothetical protein